MGKKDVKTKRFVQDSRRFADICNYYLYSGRPVIKSENLKEMDPAELMISSEDKLHTATMQKMRDILKTVVVKEADGTFYMLAGIENQSDVNYAIVVRNMLYDSINYSEQIADLAKKHRDKKELKTSSEFLSGLTANDKLVPVVTITVFWGAGEWDGARSLHEMLKETDKNVLSCVPDYKINLIVPDEIEDFSAFATDVGCALDCIKHSGSKEDFMEFLEKNKELFSAIDKETADVISECVGVKINDDDREDGKVNMSKGVRELWEDGVERGLEQGLEQGREETSITIALRLLKEGMKDTDVARITSLTIEKVKELEAGKC